MAHGLFGECFRARNKTGSEARVIVVDSRLSARKRFATALAKHSSGLGELIHPHVVTTRTVGRGNDGSLVVIASAVEEPVELRALLDRFKGSMPQNIALGLAMGALRGLSHAHEHDVIHGGVHPRSVVIDQRGISKLGDFGLARALASAAAAAEDSELLAGLRGYVAPELALGQEPDKQSDVYAAGALLSQLLWNELSPPASESGALGEVVRRAQDTNTDKRFEDASSLESALRKAIATEKLAIAPASELATFISSHQASFDTALDAETEDILSSLEKDLGIGDQTDEDVEGPRPSTALEDALAGLSSEFLRVEDSVDEEIPADPVATDFDTEEYTGELTTVDEAAEEDEDPVADLLGVVGAQPIIASVTPAAKEKKEFGRSRPAADDYVEIDETPLPAPKPFHADGTMAHDMVELVGKQAASSKPFVDSTDFEDPADALSNGGGSLKWIAIIVFVVASVSAVFIVKKDMFKASSKEAAEANLEAKRQATLDEIERMQAKPGEVVVRSETEDAAVWLLVGRTPAASFPLPSSMVHELRVEHEGFRPIFLTVGAQHWGGDKAGRKANLSVSLVATDQAVPLPAFPPEPEVPVAPGGPGRGPIVVESVPSGAEVWIWVGTTPEMKLSNVEAGKDYEFKVLKDGMLPAYVAVKSADWYLSGESGPVHPSLQREVKLEPVPEPGAGAEGADGAGDKDSGKKKKKRRSRRKAKRRSR